MLKAHNLSLTLARRPVLSSVSLTARHGQITAIVGPNGSGKSTLLRALCGELRPQGQITLDGTPIHTIPLPTLAARRAVLPQTTRLAFPFTLREVVSLGQSAGLSANQPGVISAALQAVDLEHRANARFQDLSGGEQSRGHLARALAQVWTPTQNGLPAWLFLDEPVASLDIGHQLMVMRLMADYAARGGGVVAVMHDLNLTAMFAAHVVMMEGGRVLAAGPPAAVLTDATLTRAYRTPLRVGQTPGAGAVFVLPQSAA